MMFTKKNKKTNNRQFVINEKGFSHYPPDKDFSVYQKYFDHILHLRNKFSSEINFLDIGCGAGQVIAKLATKFNSECQLVGIDIGGESIQLAKKNKNGKFLQYDGFNMPFNDNYFNIVGSYNVLEHVNNPVLFLSESLRVLKPGGYLIISCPNFLSITNSYHHHTKGLVRKIKNFLITLKKIFSRTYNFEKMLTIERENRQPDDDACVVTNPLDLLKWAKNNNLQLMYWSSQPVYKKSVVNILDYSFLKLFLGSCFMIFKKNNEKNI